MDFQNKKEFGSWGEKKAAEYLLSKSYIIVKRNFRVRQGEIDIIAVKNKYLVFVEVKTRSSEIFGPPQYAVGYFKQKKIRNTALYYLSENDYKKYKIRFDVITIMYGNEKIKIKHFKNCF